MLKVGVKKLDIQAWLKVDFYETLQVRQTDSVETIKKYYRQLAKKYHPDISGESATFREISEAYKVLGDPELKIQYDAIRFIGSHGTDGFNFVSLFGNAFEEGFREGVDRWKKGKQSKGRGHDIKTRMSITEQEAIDGVKMPVSILYERGCLDCLNGCSLCTDGWIHEEKMLTVKIPKNIKDKQRIKIVGAGGIGSQSRGDLYIDISVIKHKKTTIEKTEKTNNITEEIDSNSTNSDEETKLTKEDEIDNSKNSQKEQKPLFGPETKTKENNSPAPLKKKLTETPATTNTTKKIKIILVEETVTNPPIQDPPIIKDYIPPPPPKRTTKYSTPVKPQKVEYVELVVSVGELGKEKMLVSPLGETLRFIVPTTTKNNQILRIKKKGKINPQTLVQEDLLVQIKVNHPT